MSYTLETQFVVMFRGIPKAAFDQEADAWSYVKNLHHEHRVEYAPDSYRASVVEVHRNPKEVSNANPT